MNNPFKHAIAEGTPQLGLWNTLCSPTSAEILADTGFDWLLFDTEHAAIEVAGLLPLLRAAAGGTASPVVRVAWNDRTLIKKVLDLGAATLLVPYVQTVAEAEAAVAASKYPPMGTRGVAGSTRASRYGREKNYLHDANDEVCVLLQLETQQALQAAAEIAKVTGVDGLFIGPSDLAASMGHMGEPGAEAVQNAIRDTLAIIQDAGKPAGILAVNETEALRYIEWGFTFVAVGIDASLLRSAADQLLHRVRIS